MLNAAVRRPRLLRLSAAATLAALWAPGCARPVGNNESAKPLVVTTSARAPLISDAGVDESAPEAPPEDASAPRLRVRIGGLTQRPLVAWSRDDGWEIGMLNPVYEASGIVSEGKVAAAPLTLWVFAIDGETGSEGKLSLDFSDGASREALLEISPHTRRYVRHVVTVRDQAGHALPFVGLHVVLDGSEETARDAILNEQQLVTDEAGKVAVLTAGKHRVVLNASLPFQELEQPLEPSRDQLVLRDLSTVSCRFVCPNGRPAGFAGFVAVLRMKDGSERRFEHPYSDVLRPGPAILTWPEGSATLEVHSEGFHQALVRSPKQRCVLTTLGRRDSCE